MVHGVRLGVQFESIENKTVRVRMLVDLEEQSQLVRLVGLGSKLSVAVFKLHGATRAIQYDQRLGLGDAVDDEAHDAHIRLGNIRGEEEGLRGHREPRCGDEWFQQHADEVCRQESKLSMCPSVKL